MQGKQKIAEENMVKELLFDLSSAEKSVRAGAINTLVKYASHTGVEAAVRNSYSMEQDPYCRQALEAILDVYKINTGKLECRLPNRPIPVNTAHSQPQSKILAKPTAGQNEAVAVEKKISLVPSSVKNSSATQTAKIDGNLKQEQIKEPLPSATTPVTRPIEPPVPPVSAKEKLAAAAALLRIKLEWAAKNDVGVSGLGMGIIIVALICFVSFITYNMIMSNERFSVSSAAQMSKAVVPGEIQTDEVKSGELIQGTLKEYNIFGQTWAFLSDDNKLFKLKLNKSPGFFRVEEKLRVTVESCEKNSLGHTILVGTVEPEQISGAAK